MFHGFNWGNARSVPYYSSDFVATQRDSSAIESSAHALPPPGWSGAGKMLDSPSYHLCSRLEASMISRYCRLAAIAALATAIVDVRAVEAQYFGRNKVQYEKFDWRILKSDHFDLYFYPAESLKVHDAGRQSERWYSR